MKSRSAYRAEKHTQNLHKCILFICLLGFIPGKAQRTYDPLAIINDTMKTVIGENFYSNINGWPTGSSSTMAARFNNFGNSSSYLIDNYKQDQSIVYMVPKWKFNPQNNFVIKTEFNLDRHPAMGKNPVKEVPIWGGGFVWGATEPYKNMYIFYLRMDKPLLEYGMWNDKSEYKVLKEVETGKTRMNHFLEIQRKGNNLFCYENIKDTLHLLLTVPFQTFKGTNIGYYVSGVAYLSVKNLQIQEAMSMDERFAAMEMRSADFNKWKAIAEGLEKEKIKYKDKDISKLNKKVKENLDNISKSLSGAYFEMANIRRIENDLESATYYYTLANDHSPNNRIHFYAFYTGKSYEEKYNQGQQEVDKSMALKYYMLAAKNDRTDLDIPTALKSYYRLKYPFIEDFSIVTSYWQNEMFVPHTKEEYDLAIQRKKQKELEDLMWKQMWAELNKRPKFEALQIVLYATHPQDNYIASTMKTAPLTTLTAAELKAGDYYYDPLKKDFIMAGYDGVPLGLQSFTTIYMNRDYNFTFQMVKKVCPSCFGEGFIKVSSGGYSYQAATGRYTETRSPNLDGQTVTVTRTPVYETVSIPGKPVYEICKECNGTGGPGIIKNLTIVNR